MPRNLSFRSLLLQRAVALAAAKFKIKNMAAWDEKKKAQEYIFIAFPKMIKKIYSPGLFQAWKKKHSICTNRDNIQFVKHS